MAVREVSGRAVSPSAGIIDSQSVKISESVGPRGFDVGKKSTAASATSSPTPEGHLLAVEVNRADIQDRDDAVGLLACSMRRDAINPGS